jgi:PleD family two-component response regulator
LLSSIGNEQSRQVAHLFNVILTKPIKHSILQKQIINLLKSNGSILKEARTSKTQFDKGFAIQYPLDILVADDNAVNQKLTQQILNKMGYKPDVAVNGHDAVNAAAHKPYHIYGCANARNGWYGSNAVYTAEHGAAADNYCHDRQCTI